MKKQKSKSHSVRSIWLFVFWLAALSAVITRLMWGHNVRMLNPKGFIAEGEFNLILFSTMLLLALAIPTLVILYAVAWRFREGNQHAHYDPQASHSKLFVFSMWALPTIVVLILASVMWPSTHRLEPQKTIAPDTKSLTIQVIAMRWKWVFIYPEQHIATVNFVEIPTDTPVEFELSADETPMSSFWIPNLGGQLYAMTGHVNRLNLIAEKAGDYQGSTAEINGAGFAGMKFIARAGSAKDFNSWVKDVQDSSAFLNSAEYDKLLKPSEDNPVAYYAKVDTDLYAKMLTKYAGSHHHEVEE